MDRFVRQRELLGDEIQQSIFRLRLAVVGCSGIGSQMLQVSTLMGVRDFIIVDPAPAVEAKHLNRMVFADASSIGRPKVEVATAFLARWDPGIRCHAVQQAVQSPEAQELLKGATLIAACTDSDEADLAIHNMASSWRKPILLMKQGAALTSPGRPRFWGSLAALAVPGAACLRHICLDDRPMPQSHVSTALTGFMAVCLGWQLILGWLRREAEAPNFITYDAIGHRTTPYRVHGKPGCCSCEGRKPA